MAEAKKTAPPKADKPLDDDKLRAAHQAIEALRAALADAAGAQGPTKQRHEKQVAAALDKARECAADALSR